MSLPDEKESQINRPKELVWGELLRRNAAKWPNKVAVTYLDQKWTYRELNSRANRLANALAKQGLKKGDKVSIFLYNSIEFAEIIFGIFKAGGVIVPINYRLVASDIEYLANHNEVSFFFVGTPLLDRLEGVNFEKMRQVIVVGEKAQKGMIALEELMVSSPSDDEPTVDVWEGDTCFLITTGGTTGKPKAAIHNHRSICGIYHQQVPYYHDHSIGDRGMVCLPMYSAGGMGYDFGSTLLRGGTLYIIPFNPFDPVLALETIDKEKINHTTMAPSMLRAILALPEEVRSKYDVSSLKSLAVVGAPTDSKTREDAVRHFGEVIFVDYSASELGLVSTLRPEEMLKYPTSSGRVVSPQEVRIIDNDGNELPRGEVGEIAVSSELIFQGYYNDPEITAQTFHGRFAGIGDVGYMDDDGYIYVVDRKKDMIISGGSNIYPAEIEGKILNHPKIAEVAVIGVPDEKWGEAVLALVKLKPEMAATPEEIITWCRGKMAGYIIPKKVEFVTDFPMTAAGKIQKNVLRERYWQGYDQKIRG